MPKWNPEWQQSDPLLGRRGWAAHHYAAVAVGFLVVWFALVCVPPAVVRARQRAADLDRQNEALHEAVSAGAENTLKIP